MGNKEKLQIFKFNNAHWFDFTVECPDRETAVKIYNKFRKPGHKLK